VPRTAGSRPWRATATGFSYGPPDDEPADAVAALVGWGFIGFGVISLAIWNAPQATTAMGLYVGLFIAAGTPGVASSAGLMTIVQTAVPPTHLGRVVAVHEAGSGGLQAIGVLTAGALADRFGVLTLLDAQAGIYILCGVLALSALRAGPPRVRRRRIFGRSIASPAGVHISTEQDVSVARRSLRGSMAEGRAYGPPGSGAAR
jgi:MFS family permease